MRRRKFSTRRSLNVHVKEMHAEKTLQCLQCTSKFSTQGLLNKHVKQVHSEKTLQCPRCTSKFSTQGHLNEHVKGVHGNKKRKRVQRGAVKRVQLRELDQGPLVSAADWAKAKGWVHSC